MDINKFISEKLSLPLKGVTSVVDLIFSQSATVPFVSRYRKEATGGLDEVQIGAIKDEYERLVDLEKRKATILKSIEELGQLTDELRNKIDKCTDSTTLEDIYLPYKPKRRTRATIAKEKGLEPLAKVIYSRKNRDLESYAHKFLNDEVTSIEEAFGGAKDIIAEWINENEIARAIVRRNFAKSGSICSKLSKNKEEEGAKYSDYFNFSEPLRKTVSHRVLAIMRAEKEGILKISIDVDDELIVENIENFLIHEQKNDLSVKLVCEAISDGYKRLIRPSIENEFLGEAKQKADLEAISVFSSNLRQLLLLPPLGEKRILGIDPGFRTGCKVVCLDKNGELLHNEAIFPHPPQNDTSGAMKKVSQLLEMYKIEAIAIGDGTASRETESFIKRMTIPHKVDVYVVSEDGASVYSASKVARDEFPSNDVTVRGAVSIGRRLLDPLAELVKIDPKAIGVGQYQHDVDQGKLKNSLDTVVESCVNSVGVSLNTASKHLLSYVSGIGATIAQNIVDYRAENGAFKSRSELKKVARLGSKAFEQSAGFLRIQNGKNILDATAVHPESYPIVEKMAKDLGVKVDVLISDKATREKIDISKYVTDTIGIPTLKDIINELEKPGRDPRGEIEVFEFDNSVHTIDDLHEGMTLPGIVTNITAFGAFVDVGVKQDGLVHISQLANKFVSNVNDIVKLHQHVTVKVLEVDKSRKRIQLTMKF
ncbi:MAG: Tex family protein [Rikenellaceae bacterium]